MSDLPVAAHASALLSRETAANAVAAQARAAVEARYVMAVKQPRSILQFRSDLLEECKRPGFAAVARYSKPVGGKAIEGPSVRFVEAALRCFRNIFRETPTIYEDEEKRIVRVSVTDLEANITHSIDVTIAKTVERKKLKEGQIALGQRVNSYNETVFLVAATDDELLNKTNALISKAVRNMGLNVLPGDVVEEAQEEVRKTLRDADAKDPAAARKAIADAFNGIGVRALDLEAYLGHAIAQSSPAELADLRACYAAIRDGETTWQEIVKQREEASADQKAAEREADTLDAVDTAKVNAALDAAARKFKIGRDDVARAILGEQPLAAVAKADLPKLLRAVGEWKPAA